jgi:small subunit ribosomal protein S9
MPETIKKPVAHRVHAAARPVAVADHVATATHRAPTHKVASNRYTEAVGRRKTAIARVRIVAGTGVMTINGETGKTYFDLPRLLTTATAPADRLAITKTFDISAKVSGGGIHAQAGAIRLGLARAIIKLSPEWKKQLRAFGFLTRDSRMVERKKYGLKKARRSPQWAKR